MKRISLAVLCILVVFLLVSSSTSVPQVKSTTSMELITKSEYDKTLVEDKIQNIKDTLCTQFGDIQPRGLIDLLIQLIMFLIDVVNAIIQFMLDLFEIVDLINYLIERITVLIELIIQFVEWIMGLFNPQYL